eukprot:537978-Rhodomonas_salina.1
MTVPCPSPTRSTKRVGPNSVVPSSTPPPPRSRVRRAIADVKGELTWIARGTCAEAERMCMLETVSQNWGSKNTRNMTMKLRICAQRQFTAITFCDFS